MEEYLKKMDYFLILWYQTIRNMLKLKDRFTGERSIVLPKLVQEMMVEDPLISLLHITDIGYYPRAEYHFMERKEPIDQYVFIYVVDGDGWYRVDPISISFCRQENLTHMEPERQGPGLFIGFISGVLPHRSMPRSGMPLWIWNLTRAPALATA